MSARLLKVVVQPIYVVDQGEELIEAQVTPIVMTAAEWRALDPQTWAKAGAMAVEEQTPQPGPVSP